MAKVEVVVRPSGLINGVYWPEVGETLDLPDAVAESMAEAGTVKLVKASKKDDAEKVEKRPAPTAGVESRADKKSTARKK